MIIILVRFLFLKKDYDSNKATLMMRKNREVGKNNQSILDLFYSITVLYHMVGIYGLQHCKEKVKR